MTGEAPVASLTRRTECAHDEPFRLRLFLDTHVADFADLGPMLRETLLHQQFDAQTASYRALYPKARYEIVECGGAPVGRLAVDFVPGAMLIVDIALLAAWHGRGFGTLLLRGILDEARVAGVSVRLSVLAGNTGALALYKRLGFVVIARTGVDVSLEYPSSRHAEGERLQTAEDGARWRMRSPAR